VTASEGRFDVGVVGATGYTGRELCRLLLGHRAVRRILPTARGDERFEATHRNMTGSGLEFTSFETLRRAAHGLGVVFFCTPSGEAMASAGEFLEAGVRVVDLSADFRFPEAEAYRRAHGVEHSAPHLLPVAQYGATELYRDAIRAARLIANPGCYVIAALLGLAPLMRDPRIDLDARITIHAINGTTGAGKTVRTELMHAAAANTILPYSLEGHRHAPEIEEQLARLAGRSVTIDLSTAHGNFPRGIFLQANVVVRDAYRRDVARDSLLAHYRDAYAAEHFIQVVGGARSDASHAKDYHLYPDMASVIGSNFNHLGLDYDSSRGTIKVISVIDNLVKGAAGSAIQNMNVMMGIAECEAIGHYGL